MGQYLILSLLLRLFALKLIFSVSVVFAKDSDVKEGDRCHKLISEHLSNAGLGSFYSPTGDKIERNGEWQNYLLEANSLPVDLGTSDQTATNLKLNAELKGVGQRVGVDLPKALLGGVSPYDKVIEFRKSGQGQKKDKVEAIYLGDRMIAFQVTEGNDSFMIRLNEDCEVFSSSHFTQNSKSENLVVEDFFCRQRDQISQTFVDYQNYAKPADTKNLKETKASLQKFLHPVLVLPVPEEKEMKMMLAMCERFFTQTKVDAVSQGQRSDKPRGRGRRSVSPVSD